MKVDGNERRRNTFLMYFLLFGDRLLLLKLKRIKYSLFFFLFSFLISPTRGKANKRSQLKMKRLLLM
jgi:hypothetical protein